MTSNKYIVKNCPCYTSKGGYYDCWANQDTWCENVTDCVIKQVIEKCKENLSSLETYIDIRSYECTMLQDILNLFDIEEVRE